MRARLVWFICVSLLFTGCKNSNDSLSKALMLRNSMLEKEGCSFSAVVTADYGEELYLFSLSCRADHSGDLTFTVTAPATISGITGKITDSGGSITFDDKILAFPMMADGQITPVTAPWIFIKTLRSGYLNACSNWDNGYQISIDDSYRSDALHLNISVNADNLPIEGEIIWQNHRVVSIAISDFVFL